MTSWRRIALVLLVSLAAALFSPACSSPERFATATADPTPSHYASGCHAPAPTTAAGYTAAFSRIPVAQWGGGDVAITVTLGTRHVWLFGDTLSTSRFVHSSAITQDGGCFHVSHGGAQLLPDSGSAWWWIESASRVTGSTIRVKAEIVHRTGTGAWGFATGRSRYALAVVSAAGDVTFTRWLPGTVPSDKPRGVLRRLASGQVSYGRYVHRDIPVAGGYLVTTCRNWDDGRLHPLRTYAPAFSAG